MSRFDFPLPEGAEVLDATGKGNTSNVTLLIRQGSQRFILKIYRCRRSRVREALRSQSHRFIEGKRGAGARERCETEKLSLGLWLREGFAVVRPLDRPIPQGIRHPALWLEYCPHPTVQSVLRDPSIAPERKEATVRLLAASAAARHRRAMDLHEPLLIHEHGTANHFFTDGKRIITYDLENGFQADMPVIEAVTQEVASLVKSLIRDAGPPADEMLRAFTTGYSDRPLLEAVLDHALKGSSPLRRFRRWYDRRKRPATGKTAALERLAAVLE
jgi:hypothetical protein